MARYVLVFSSHKSLQSERSSWGYYMWPFIEISEYGIRSFLVGIWVWKYQVCPWRMPGLGGGSRCVTLLQSVQSSGRASNKKECHAPLQVFLSTYVCVWVFSGFVLTSSDPVKIDITIAVNFNGTWLEFYLNFFSNCTKQCKLRVF